MSIFKKILSGKEGDLGSVKYPGLNPRREADALTISHREYLEEMGKQARRLRTFPDKKDRGNEYE